MKANRFQKEGKDIRGKGLKSKPSTTAHTKNSTWEWTVQLGQMASKVQATRSVRIRKTTTSTTQGGDSRQERYPEDLLLPCSWKVRTLTVLNRHRMGACFWKELAENGAGQGIEQTTPGQTYLLHAVREAARIMGDPDANIPLDKGEQFRKWSAKQIWLKATSCPSDFPQENSHATLRRERHYIIVNAKF